MATAVVTETKKPVKTEPGQVNYRTVGMTVEEFIQACEASFWGGIKRHRIPMPLFAHGAPGVGKTFAVNEVKLRIERRMMVTCDSCGKSFQQGTTMICPFCEHGNLRSPCDLYALSTAAIEPIDISGLPDKFFYPGEDVSRFSVYMPMQWAWEISVEYEEYMREKKSDPSWCAPPAILFFDDLTGAVQQNQTAFFKGIHEGLWGCYRQRPNVIVLSAGNRTGDNAGACEMTTALGTRERHVYINLSVRDWLKYGKGFRLPDEPGIKGEARIHNLVTSFIARIPGALFVFDQAVAIREEKASACPRSWHNLSELIYEDEIVPEGIEDGKIEVAQEKGEPTSKRFFAKMCAGIVGTGEASLFLGFVFNSKALISAEEIVRNPHKARIPAKENLDAIHATVNGLMEYVRQNTHTWEAALVYVLRPEISSDLGLMMYQDASEVIEMLNPEDRGKAMGSDVLDEAAKRFDKLMGNMDLGYDHPMTR